MLSIATAAVWDLARGTGLSENMMDLVWLICVRCLWDCSWNIGARGTNRGVTDIGATRHGNTKVSWKKKRVDISKKIVKSLERSREL